MIMALWGEIRIRRWSLGKMTTNVMLKIKATWEKRKEIKV